MPRFTLQAEIFNLGVATPFIRNGVYVYQIPGLKVSESNSPAHGFLVKGDSISIKLTSTVSEELRAKIYKNAANQIEAQHTLNNMQNIELEEPHLSYDKGEVTVVASGSLLLNYKLDSDPKVVLIF